MSKEQKTAFSRVVIFWLLALALFFGAGYAMTNSRFIVAWFLVAFGFACIGFAARAEAEIMESIED